MAAEMRAGSYYYGGPRRESASTEEPLGPKKTLLVLVVVIGCFAVLWPKVFYPMLVNSANNQIKPSPADKTSGCCDVISDVDLDTIKIMSELCSTIIEGKAAEGAEPKDLVAQCRKTVLETCGIDISAVLQERVSLGHSTKQILEEARSLNGSLCLKYNFGVSPWSLGVSHRVHFNIDPTSSIKQERSAQLRPEMVHPAFKERGRAIPQPESTTRRPGPPPKIVEGRPGPIPGMRPAMGGPGHMVPPSKQANNGFLGVLMPVYTIGFVVFFTYTIMKLVFKKKPEEYVGAALYPEVDTDDQFHKEVFEANRNYYHRPSRDNSKIVVNAVSALLEEVNQELEARKQKTVVDTVTDQDNNSSNGEVFKDEKAEQEVEIEKEEQGSVTVMGMETTASCEGGKRWSRPDSPVLPHPPPVPPKEPSPPPQQIFLEGSLPPQSQLLVSDSATETQKEPEEDAPVVLAGKMTLSVISLDSETGTEDSSLSGKKAESPEGDRRSSGNTSDEFEKINASDLEDQINSIIEEAEIIALNDEKRLTLSEELDQLNDETIQEIDVLEEIKNQLNLEDDLIKVIAGKDPEPVKLPVTELIKEFLSEEENVLLAENIGVNNIEKEVADALKEENEKLLSDEEKEIIAKYQALEEEEEPHREPESTNDINNEQQQLEKLLTPPEALSAPVNTSSASTQFIKNEEQALLHENLESNQDTSEIQEQVPVGQASVPSPADEDPKPVETEPVSSRLEIPIQVAPREEEETIEAGNDAKAFETPNPPEISGELPPVEVKDEIHEEELRVLEQDSTNESIESIQVVPESNDEKEEPATSRSENSPIKESTVDSIESIEGIQDVLEFNDEKEEPATSHRENSPIKESTVDSIESIESIQDVPKSNDDKEEPTPPPSENSPIEESAVDTIKEDKLLQEEVLESGDQDEAHKRVVRETVEESGDGAQQEVVATKSELEQTETSSARQNIDGKQTEVHQDASTDHKEPRETEIQERKESQTSSIEPITSESQSVDDLDIVEQVIEDVEYVDESDGDELPRDGASSEERLNGVENEDSENDLDDDDVEIEEVIEYVDNTDEEGEEIIEINGNQQERNFQNHN